MLVLKNTEIVFDIWKSHDNYLGRETVSEKSPDITNYLADMFCPGAYYYYIINSPTLTLDIVSPSVQQLLGIKPEDFTLKHLIEIIHPDDVQFCMKCEDIVAYFLKNCIPPEKMTCYKINYCLREKTAEKGYRLFLLQTITMKTTSDGALLKVFGSHTDITHLTSENNHKLSLIGLNGEPSYLEIEVFNGKVLNNYRPFDLHAIYKLHDFTKRELEIIQYLAIGYTTEKIAGLLSISRNTVETHRRNALAKTNVNNSTELVVECIKKGII